MSLLFGLLLLFPALTSAQDSQGDEERLLADDLDRFDGRFGFFIHARVGFVAAPYPAPESAEARGRAASTIPRVHYEVVERLRIGLRVPLLDTSPELPASSVVTERVVGNPELLGDYRIPWTDELTWDFRLGLGVPIGGGSADPQDPLLQNKAFALVNAVHGAADPELHWPGRFGVTATARLSFHRGRFHAGGMLKLPFLFQARDGGDDPRAEVRPVAWLPVIGGHASWDPVDWMFLTLRTWIAVQAVAPIDADGAARSAVDFVVEPQVSFVISNHVVISATLTLPYAGDLAGEVIAPGLHAGLIL